MIKPNIKTLAHAAQTALGHYGPQILTGMGIAGMITATVLAVKATPKALELIDEEKARINDEVANSNDQEKEPIEKLGPVQTVKAAWKPYIPALIIGTVSVGCLISATSENVKRIAALTTAYKLSETALSEYKDAVVETIGKNKEKEVRNKVAEERVKNNPAEESTVIITNKGETLCYDHISGRYFKSDIDKIKKAESQLNLKLRNHDYASLNTWYDLLGLEPIGIGDRLGWNIDSDGYIDVDFSAQLTNEGVPCIVMDYSEDPKYDFDRY